MSAHVGKSVSPTRHGATPALGQVAWEAWASPGELAQVEGAEHRERAQAFLGDWTLHAGTSRHRGAVRCSLSGLPATTAPPTRAAPRYDCPPDAHRSRPLAEEAPTDHPGSGAVELLFRVRPGGGVAQSGRSQSAGMSVPRSGGTSAIG